MSHKTIRVSGLPQHITKEQIKYAFSDLNIKRIHKQKDHAFILLEDGANSETFSLNFSELIIPALQTAIIKQVNEQFTWENIQDDAEQIKSLKSQKSQEFAAGEYPVLQPDYMKKLLITNCYSKVIEKMTEQQIKKQMFESFNIESVTKVYKNTEEGVLVLEFYESEEVEKLLEMAETQEGKFQKLGQKIVISRVDQEFNLTNLIEGWKRQFQILQNAKIEKQPTVAGSLVQKKGKQVNLKHFFFAVFIFWLIYVILI